MGKKTRVAQWGRQNRSIMVDADATEGATLGKDIYDEDGELVTLQSITNYVTNNITTILTDPRSVFPTLWELILNIPDIVKSLVGLSTDGWMRNNSGVISAQEVNYTKNSVETGESATIPEGHQALVWDEFTFDGGDLVIDGDLVVLGDNDGTVPVVTLTDSTLTLDSNNNLVLADATSNPITVILPAAVDYPDREYTVKKIDAVANDVTLGSTVLGNLKLATGDNLLLVDGVSKLSLASQYSDLIDDELTQVISFQFDAIKVKSDGANWWII